MEYYVRHVDEYSEDPRQGNKFAPAWPFRLLVSGSSDSGKTTMIINLLMGNKKIKEDGERYVLCNDIVLIGKHLDEPKWNIVRDLYNELAEEGEDVSFTSLPATEIPDVEDFDPNRATVVVFEDLMNMPRKIQERIANYFSSGRHSNISAIYVSQRFFLTPKTIRENVTYISLHKGAGSLADIKRIISLYTEHSESLASIIDDLTRKKEFIIFDHRCPKDDPLSIRVRWDTSLRSIIDQSQIIQDQSKIIHNNLRSESKIIHKHLRSESKIIHPVNSNLLRHVFHTQHSATRFSSYGQKLVAESKINGSLVEFARNMPSPKERKKILAEGVSIKNSGVWARYIYREAFGIKEKNLGPDWAKFVEMMNQLSSKEAS